MDSYVQPMLLDKRCQFMRCAHELRNLEPWPVAYQGLYAWAGEERGVRIGIIFLWKNKPHVFNWGFEARTYLNPLNPPPKFSEFLGKCVDKHCCSYMLMIN